MTCCGKQKGSRLHSKTSIAYLYVRRQSTIERAQTFEYVPAPPLPAGTTNEAIFRRAIQECNDSERKMVLIDLYRFLVFSNYARFDDNVREREPSLQHLDVVYPYAHKLAEASGFNATWHQSRATNTSGAVLYLLIHSRNPPNVTEILGRILVSMLSHRKYRNETPRIDAEMSPTV